MQDALSEIRDSDFFSRTCEVGKESGRLWDKRKEGKIDQITLCACMKSSNNKKLLKHKSKHDKILQQSYVTKINYENKYSL